MKTAVITGASSGLGREFVRQMQAQFPDIGCYWLIARRTDRLQALAEQLPGISVKTISLDLTSGAAFTELEALLGQEQPQVSLLINCAGCGILGDLSRESWTSSCGWWTSISAL